MKGGGKGLTQRKDVKHDNVMHVHCICNLQGYVKPCMVNHPTTLYLFRYSIPYPKGHQVYASATAS